MQPFSDQIRAALAECTGLAEDAVVLNQPRDTKLGDVAFPCFQLAKERKVPPPKLAAELTEQLASRLTGISVVATGPFLNFKVDRGLLARTLIEDVAAQGERYGSSQVGAGKTVVIDFSSPNIAKPMHVGHLRSTILGQAIERLHTALGYRTVGINHIGDWGSQFGGLVVAIRRWRDSVDLEENPVSGLLDLYQRSKLAIEEDEGFREEARAAWRELESGEEGEVRELWRWVTEVSLAAFDKTYARLGIHHDHVRGESTYEPELEATVRRIEAAGVTEMSEGAEIVALGVVDKGLEKTPCLLRQRDGTTLYATRDLAALFSRWEEFAFERALYVVGSEQKLHFRQLKAVLTRMDLDWEGRVEHVDFGLLLGPGRVKLASRKKGAVLILDELLDEVVEEARRIVAEKNPELDDARCREIAEQVGIGAIVFNDLRRERIRDVVFDKSEILSFEGETGPYLQYTHARLASIERKAADAGEGGAEPDWSALEDAADVLLTVGRFPQVVESAAANCEPSEVSRFLLSLAREMNSWYVGHRVLGQEPGLTAARLGLVRAVRTVLGCGLTLLGIAAPQEM